MEKKKRIISQENLEPKVLEMFLKKYPNGFTGFVQNITSPKGENLHVVPLETDDSIFLVKVKVVVKKTRDDEDEEDFGDDIPEAGDGLDGDKDEFGGGEEEEDGYDDEPADDAGEDDDED
jgi:hypothetical protein